MKYQAYPKYKSTNILGLEVWIGIGARLDLYAL